ncbi:MAG: D-alanyl-D-alanine carboxypeptidase family protein [Candidatus Geothermincolia bacterium]
MEKKKGKLKKPRAVALALVILLIFIFFVSCLLTLADANAGPTIAESVREIKAPAGVKAEAPGVWANAAVLTDAESGRMLYEKNAHEKLPMASTTKMMTALVVRSRCKLKDQVEITPEAANVGEEAINLVPGEKLTVEQLLNVMLIQSANDAAFALAQHAGGSMEGFSGLMNKMAAEIGAKDSHFTNPHGLDQAGHYSSAYDLAVIGRALMQDPVLAKMVSTPKYSIPMPGQPWNRVAVGHNEILTRYTGADGIKTGYTAKAGFCLVASARRDGKSLIAVALNSSHRADDVTALFNYGFTNTARLVFVKKGQRLGTSKVSSFPRRSVAVVPQGEMAALSFIGSKDVFKVVTSVQRTAHSPVKAGQNLGTISVLLNNALFEKGNAVSARSRSASNFIGSTGAFLWYSLCWTGKIISAPFRIF